MHSRWPDGTPRSQGNAFGLPVTSACAETMVRAQTAARIGRASASTKRRKGLELMPRLHMHNGLARKAL